MDSKSPRTQEGEQALINRRAARLRLLLIVAGVLAVAGFALAIYLAVREESIHERWDVLEKLRTDFEPAQDPIWENPYGVYNPERERYIAALEKFLDDRAKETDDALEPHTRFLIAKTIADHILSNPGMVDMEDRSAWYAKGVAQLEAIRDDFPDFPLNWTRLSPEGYPSLTRQIIDWFAQNEAWEREYMLEARDVAADVRVLVRTERGDMIVGLYRELAPKWTAAFLDRAARGFYDGTAFVEKQDVGDATDPEKQYVRGGGAATRGAKAFDAEQHDEIAKTKLRAGLLPEESRNRIPHERGIVSAWHALADEYDADAPFLVVVRRSPSLDYRYTPIGKVLDDDRFTSTRTLDRIFGGNTWREDSVVRDDANLAGVLDYLQAPVKIVKVLVYENGTLREPGDDVLDTRAELEDGEKSLATVQVDRYKVEPPVRPEEPKPDDEDDAGEDMGEGEGAGDEPSDEGGDR
jgi:cyclophilin family peptidyl-prolyl cis-trans isomerase